MHPCAPRSAALRPAHPMLRRPSLCLDDDLHTGTMFCRNNSLFRLVHSTIQRSLMRCKDRMPDPARCCGLLLVSTIWLTRIGWIRISTCCAITNKQMPRLDWTGRGYGCSAAAGQMGREFVAATASSLRAALMNPKEKKHDPASHESLRGSTIGWLYESKY